LQSAAARVRVDAATARMMSAARMTSWEAASMMMVMMVMVWKYRIYWIIMIRCVIVAIIEWIPPPVVVPIIIIV
jgi:hypothetical protein